MAKFYIFFLLMIIAATAYAPMMSLREVENITAEERMCVQKATIGNGSKKILDYLKKIIIVERKSQDQAIYIKTFTLFGIPLTERIKVGCRWDGSIFLPQDDPNRYDFINEN